MAEACPKCGTTRDDARTHCATCGLAHDKMAAFAAARDAVPDALAKAWDDAVADWENVTHHDELLRLVTHHDAYAWAAGRYRERIRVHADDAVAHRELARVRKAAEVTLIHSAATRAAKAPTPYRSTMMILGVLIFLVIALALYAVVRGGGK